MSIGQGFLLVTPLQMANLIAAVSNGGTLFRPHIVKRIETPEGKIIKEFFPEKIGELNLPAETLAVIQQGLWAAVNEIGGTARGASVPGIELAGKTSTAQNPSGEAHGWFIAFAPFENPHLALAIMIEHGKSGAASAAPIAREIISRYFGIKKEEKPIKEEIPINDLGEIVVPQ
jgi:penicillin-binding protein 2